MSNWLNKVAYVPLTMAAQQAPAQSMSPQNAQAGGMPPMMPPGGDPSMRGAPAAGVMPPEAMTGGMPPMQGGMPPMPEQQAAGGMQEPQIDPSTGFIILDLQQGIMQDPLTGLLYNAQLDQFAAPDGSGVIPDEQAIQMITQARMMQAQGGDQNVMPVPSQGVPVPVQPGIMQPPMGGAPAPAPMPPQIPPAGPPPMRQTAAAETDDSSFMQAMPPVPQGTFDQATGMMMDPASGMPIDQATGMLIDPATGSMIDPSTGQPVPVDNGMNEAAMNTDIPVDEYLNTIITSTQATEKNIDRVQKETSGLRTDLQGLRREIQKTNDTQDTVMARMDNLLNIMESILGQSSMQAPVPTD